MEYKIIYRMIDSTTITQTFENKDAYSKQKGNIKRLVDVYGPLGRAIKVDNKEVFLKNVSFIDYGDYKD